MKFRIHWDDGNYEDSIDITGDDIEEIRDIAKEEMDKRGWQPKNIWSEEIK